jgi:membrane protein DedA with SNARE-associated domain
MDQIAGLLREHGVLLVFANVLLTQIGLPLPAVPMLIVAGALAHQGDFSYTAILAAAVIASLAGDAPWFYAGRVYGYRVLNTLCRMALEPSSCVKQTENIFERWGAPSLLVAKFVPGFATVAPPLAGATRVPLAAFIAYSACGALLWAGVAVGAGAIFHSQVHTALAWLEKMGAGAVVVVAIVLAAFAAIKWVERTLFLRMLRMARITPAELNALMQRGPAPVVLDARSSGARRADPRRVASALAVDPAAPDDGLKGLDREHEVIVYCS